MRSLLHLALLPSLVVAFVPLIGPLNPLVKEMLIPNPSITVQSQGLSSSSVSSSTSLNLTPDGSSSPPNLTNLKKKRLMSFERYLEVECWSQPELKALEPVLSSVATACVQISKMVSRAQTDDIYGAAMDSSGRILDSNIQGETQQKLDVVCNEIMLRAFCSASGNVAAVASEEEDEARPCKAVMDSDGVEFSEGEYVAVFDPIDGSKNIDSSLPVGTIFGIYKYKDLPPAGVGTFLQRGSNLVASGYCLYSATTVLVLTMGKGVDGFTLDPDRRQFLRTHEDMRVPDSGPLICMNEGNYREYNGAVQHYLKQVKQRGVSDGKGGFTKAQGRYVGALVADAHNVLINGGIYGYPGTRENPNGKIRLMYESNPMGMIMEQAGGAASTGKEKILEVEPTEIHQRVPTFLGSPLNIMELDECFKYIGE